MAPASLRWHGEPWPLGRGLGGADIGSLTHTDPVRDKLLGATTKEQRSSILQEQSWWKSPSFLPAYKSQSTFQTLTVLLTGRYTNWPRDIIDRAYIDRFQFLAVQGHYWIPLKHSTRIESICKYKQQSATKALDSAITWLLNTPLGQLSSQGRHAWL